MHTAKLSLLVLFLVLHGSNQADADWLTPQERDFFYSLGSRVFVNDVLNSASYKKSRMEQLAKETPEPLRGQITGFAEARREVQDVNNDRGLTGQHYVRAVNEIIPQLPRDPKERRGPEYEALYLTLLSKNPNVTKAWFAERDRLEKGLRALDSEASHMSAILDGVKKRVGRQANPGQPFRIEVKPDNLTGGEHLWIVGKPGPGFSEGAILQILVHTPPAKGTWNVGFRHKNLSFWWVGSELVQRLQDKDAAVGAELTKFQEQAKDRPSVLTFLVPPVNAGAELKYNLMLPGSLSHYTDRIEIRCWCKSGSFTIESVPGLDGARKRTFKSEADKLMPPSEKLSGTLPGPGPIAPRGSSGGPFQTDPLLRPGKDRGSQSGGIPFPPPPPGLPEVPKGAEVEPKDGRSVPKPETAKDLLYPGSLWKGTYPGRLTPRGKTITIEFAITSRTGTPNRDVDEFVGKVMESDDTGIGTHERIARGKVAKDGAMTWQQFHLDGSGEVPSYRARLLKENVLDVERVLEGKVVTRKFKLEYVPPK